MFTASQKNNKQKRFRKLHDQSNSTTIDFMFTFHTEVETNSTFLEENTNERMRDFVPEYDEDPMQKIEGEDAEKFLFQLSKKSNENKLEILRDAEFSGNTATFHMTIRFNED